MRRLMLAAALLATASCKPYQPSPPQGIFSAISTAMPDCKPTSPPARDEITRVVRVVVRVPIDTATAQRDVTYSDPTGNVDDDANTPNSMDDMVTPPTPFDVELKQMDKGDGKYAMIRIILKDKNSDYSFYTWKDANGKDVNGVGNGSPDNDMHFCGAKIKPGLKWPVAVFYVRINKKSSKPDLLRSFNFGIVASQNPTTPIFIDPSVKNNG